MLLMSMSKWKQLRIQVPHETLYSLSLYAGFLVSLSTLIIDDTPRGTDNLSRPIDTFHLASSLKRVEINPRVTTHLQLPWKQLTHLSSWGTHNGQSLEILKRVQGVDASIKNLSFVFHNSKIPPISFDGSGPVLLPKVTFISAGENAPASTFVANLFKNIKTPNLEELILDYNHAGVIKFPAIPSDWQIKNLKVCCNLATQKRTTKRLKDFLTKAQSLSSLVLAVKDIDVVLIMDLFRESNRKNILPCLAILDLRQSTYDGITHLLIVNMIASRRKRQKEDESLLRQLRHDSPLVLDDPQVAAQWKKLCEEGLEVKYGS